VKVLVRTSRNAPAAISVTTPSAGCRCQRCPRRVGRSCVVSTFLRGRPALYARLSIHWRRGHLVWLQAAAKTSAAERERCAAIVERWKRCAQEMIQKGSAWLRRSVQWNLSDPRTFPLLDVLDRRTSNEASGECTCFRGRVDRWASWDRSCTRRRWRRWRRWWCGCWRRKLGSRGWWFEHFRRNRSELHNRRN
jgi:hypothetical protein